MAPPCARHRQLKDRLDGELQQEARAEEVLKARARRLDDLKVGRESQRESACDGSLESHGSFRVFESPQHGCWQVGAGVGAA